MTDIERFMANVIPEPNSGCWLWVGATNKTGYGSFHPQRSNPTNAHRWLFKETTGMNLNGLSVCHKCDLPVCVNPQHMFPGTQKENIQDAARKGRKKHQPWRKPVAKRTLCYKGHPLEGDNVYLHKDGRRRCLVCANRRLADSKLRSRIETSLKAIIRKHDAEQAARWKEANGGK